MALLWRMKKSQQCVFLGGVLILMHGVFTAVPGGDFECKPSPWIYRSKATIVFRLDKNTFDSRCTNRTSGLPFFLSSPDGKGTYIQNCTVTTDIRTNCSFPAGALGCGCVNSNDNGFYLIEYNFIAAPDYNRWWRADISCTDEAFQQILDFSGTNCKNITGVTSTSPPPPTTTTPVTTTSPPPPTTTTPGNTTTSVGNPTTGKKENTTETTSQEGTMTTTTTTTTTTITTTGHNPQKNTTNYVVIGFCSAAGAIVIVVGTVLACRHCRRRKKRREMDCANRDQPANRDSKAAGKVNEYCRDTHM